MIGRMVRRALTRVAATAGGVAVICLVASAATVSNFSFETPALSSGWENNPTEAGTIWAFTGFAGIAHQGSPWFAGSPPDGSQAAWLQYNGLTTPGTMSQVLADLIPNDNYQFTFWAVRRDASRYGNFDVLLGGNTILSVSVDPDSSSWVQYTTNSMAATSSSMTLEFQMLDFRPAPGYDAAVAIDLVEVHDLSESAPEPVSAALLGLGIAAVMTLRRRNRAANAD